MGIAIGARMFVNASSRASMPRCGTLMATRRALAVCCSNACATCCASLLTIFIAVIDISPFVIGLSRVTPVPFALRDVRGVRDYFRLTGAAG
ncbi:hypothetical protein [Paraburkholderia humisilvae]|uniref:hypothetical protein n=1 Tax=Paraburkholderia humisilvae TaxID=627669 RepID=UPI0035EDA9C8